MARTYINPLALALAAALAAAGRRIQQEPVLFQALAQAALACAAGFGWWRELTPEQMGELLALSAAVLSLVTRQRVTPIVNPRAADGAPLVPAAPSPEGDPR